MNFYEWRKVQGLAMDAAPKKPKGETLEEHRKHCKAEHGNCPFEKDADENDILSSETKAKVPTLEELYDLYEAEGVSPNVDEAVKNLHDAIISGKVKPIRMPVEAFKNADVPKWMLGAYYVASNYPDDETATRVLNDFAKTAGVFVGDTMEYCTKKCGDSIGSGMEATVFKDGNKVLKSSSLGLGSEEVMQKIERIMLGNRYFPESRYEVEGIGTDPEGGISFVLSQPFVKIDKDNPLTEDEVAEWAKKKGFPMKDSFLHNCASTGGDLACMDMHNENVVRTVDGNVVCIDPCVIPNVYNLEMHGFYDYDDPPETFA